MDEIRALQLDWELGRVDDEEYHRRLNDYRVQAASRLRERDLKFEKLDAELESEILEARSVSQDQVTASNQPSGLVDETVGSHENDGPPA